MTGHDSFKKLSKPFPLCRIAINIEHSALRGKYAALFTCACISACLHETIHNTDPPMTCRAGNSEGW